MRVWPRFSWRVMNCVRVSSTAASGYFSSSLASADVSITMITFPVSGSLM